MAPALVRAPTTRRSTMPSISCTWACRQRLRHRRRHAARCACARTPTWPPRVWSTPATSTNTDRHTTIGVEARLRAGSVQGAGRVHAPQRRSLRGELATQSSRISAATAGTFTACGTSPAKPGPTRPACRSPGIRTIRRRACGRSACATTRVDLNDDLVRGGVEDNLTLGVNWYWRSNFKFWLNYVMVKSEKYNRQRRWTQRSTRTSSRRAPSSTGNGTERRPDSGAPCRCPRPRVMPLSHSS